MKLWRSLFRKEYPILLLLLTCLCLGVVTFRHYGESWDEEHNRNTAQLCLKFYRQVLHPQAGFSTTHVWAPYDGLKPQYHGPAYYIFTKMCVDNLKCLIPGWRPIEYWHFTYLFTFLVGLTAIYRLARRLVGPWPACVATALFASQPLIWGNVFINMKDTPFLAVFSTAIALGLEAADRFLFRRVSSWLLLAFSAFALGFGTSMRLIAPLGGFLVMFYFFAVSRKKAIVPVLVYALLALVTMVVTWPFLWTSPLANLLEAARGMAAYPWRGAVLFDGKFYADGKDLPWTYVPVLLGITLTEPALLLALGAGMLRLFRSKQMVRPSCYKLILLAWFLVPLLYVILFHPVLYDNMRHFLFCLPPIFILSAPVLECLFSKVRTAVLKTGLSIVILLPGLGAASALHPYEYTYYNSLTSGTGGAFRRFEMDYWLTCYREAAEYLNQTAPRNATIRVSREQRILRNYARSDLTVTGDMNQAHPGDLILLTTRYNDDQNRFKDTPTLRTIGRAGAQFCVIRQVGGQ